MDRRDFIRTTSTLLAGASLARRALGEAAGTNGAPGRMILPINRGWRFSPKAVEGGHEKHFDDSSLERVVIPHTNKRLPWHGFDEKEYEFVSLYRRRFKVPSRAKKPWEVRGTEGVCHGRARGESRQPSCVLFVTPPVKIYRPRRFLPHDLPHGS